MVDFFYWIYIIIYAYEKAHKYIFIFLWAKNFKNFSVSITQQIMSY